MKAKHIFEVMSRSYHESTHTTRGDVEWLYHETPECITIAFRGTETKGSIFYDVVRNLVSLIPWKHKDVGWASLGYLRGADCAVADLYKFLESKHHNDKQIILCGHSMGAAISFLCAKIMHADGVPIHSWVGTGAVNCVITEQHPHFECFNFRYRKDFISIFPFKFFGFKQPAPYILFGSGDHKNDNLFRLGDMNDHSMKVYLDNVPDVDIM